MQNCGISNASALEIPQSCSKVHQTINTVCQCKFSLSLLCYVLSAYRHFFINILPLSAVLMAWCKTAVSPLLMHWRYHSMALSHWLGVAVYLFLLFDLFFCSRSLWEFFLSIHCFLLSWDHLQDWFDSVHSLRAKFFIENIKMYLQFISLLHTDMTQAVEILPLVRQELIYST